MNVECYLSGCDWHDRPEDPPVCLRCHKDMDDAGCFIDSLWKRIRFTLLLWRCRVVFRCMDCDRVKWFDPMPIICQECHSEGLQRVPF